MHCISIRTSILIGIVSALLVGGCSTVIQSQTPIPTINTTETQTLPLETPSATATIIPTLTPLATGLPDGIIPNGIGISTHDDQYTYFRISKKYDLLNPAGIRIVHDVLPRLEICSQPTQCNFSHWDAFVSRMSKLGIRVMFILDGYDPGPTTEEERKAFAQFAATAAKRYAGKGIIWEIWTEPDGDWSWRPKSDPQQYILLLDETIPAMREADPNAFIVGPSVSTLTTIYGDNSWRFLKAVGDAGLLAKFDAIDVHLYNGGDPESQIANLRRLRRLIDSYSPDRKIPIVSGEWGYNSGDVPEDVWFGRLSSRDEQAKFLARSLLVKNAHEITLSIWYDWQDDSWGAAGERHFGVLTSSGEPKPAFYALSTLTTTLNGYQFVRRLAIGTDHDFLLLFRNGHSGVLVAWTTDASHSLTFPGVTSSIQSIDLLGEQKLLAPDPIGLTIQLSDSPQYLLLPEGLLANEGVFWQPDGTFFRIDSNGHAEIPIIVQNPSTQKETFELQANLNNRPVGKLDVDLAPNETKTVSLPLDIKSSRSDQLDFLATVMLIQPDHQESSWVWLQK